MGPRVDSESLTIQTVYQWRAAWPDLMPESSRSEPHTAASTQNCIVFGAYELNGTHC